MEKQQELEWEAAQNTEINVDLVSAAKRQLKFLEAVDRNRWLYDSPGLDRAIYRQAIHCNRASFRLFQQLVCIDALLMLKLIDDWCCLSSFYVIDDVLSRRSIAMLARSR